MTQRVRLGVGAALILAGYFLYQYLGKSKPGSSASPGIGISVECGEFLDDGRPNPNFNTKSCQGSASAPVDYTDDGLITSPSQV